MNSWEYNEKLHECREDLADRLGVEQVPDSVWGYVIKLDLVHDVVVKGDDRSWKELVREARAYLKAGSDGVFASTGEPKVATSLPRHTERGMKEEVDVELDDYSRKRGQVFSEVAAAFAHNQPEVRHFRYRCLGGRLLTNEEAGTFLEANSKSIRPAALIIRDALYRLAEELAKTYRWREDDALWFVLTGDVPEIRPVTVAVARNLTRKHPNTAQIILTVEPWVDVREVTRIYRGVQKQVLGKAENKKRTDRVLDAVRFVVQQIREHGDEPWSRRTERWNRAFPERRYKDYRGLRQAFERVVHPTYHRPKWKPHKPSPYQTWRDKRRRAENARREQYR